MTPEELASAFLFDNRLLDIWNIDESAIIREFAKLIQSYGDERVTQERKRFVAFLLNVAEEADAQPDASDRYRLLALINAIAALRTLTDQSPPVPPLSGSTTQVD